MADGRWPMENGELQMKNKNGGVRMLSDGRPGQ
jgi:hypothetical protein